MCPVIVADSSTGCELLEYKSLWGQITVYNITSALFSFFFIVLFVFIEIGALLPVRRKDLLRGNGFCFGDIFSSPIPCKPQLPLDIGTLTRSSLQCCWPILACREFWKTGIKQSWVEQIFKQKLDVDFILFVCVLFFFLLIPNKCGNFKVLNMYTWSLKFYMHQDFCRQAAVKLAR